MLAGKHTTTGPEQAEDDHMTVTGCSYAPLADDLPQVAELDLNPVIARPDGVFAVDARVRVTSHRAADPFLRQLRTPPGERRPDEEGVPQ